MEATEKTQRQLRELARVEPLAWIESRLWIKNKAGTILPFRLNTQQRRLYALVRRLRKEGRLVRIIILKARQIGFSTAIGGFIFERLVNVANQNARVIAHEVDAAQRVFDMSRRFYDNMPTEDKPASEYSNRRELRFVQPCGSAIEIETARNVAGARSSTVQFVHFSEAGFYGGDAKEAMGATLASVPKSVGTEVYEESTANGIGNEFHLDWVRAVTGESDFLPFFVAWHQHPEYQMALTPDFKRTDEEEALAARYTLTDEQLMWRRWVIRNDYMGDDRLFRQDNPSCPDEAFLTSGSPVFDQREVQWQRTNCVKEPVGWRDIKWPKFAGWNGGLYDDDKITIVPSSGRGFAFWQLPTEKESWRDYLIAVDVAEGLAHGDLSYITVWRRSDMCQVGEWVGHVDPDELGLLVCGIGRLYGYPWVGVEVNNHGHTTVAALKRLRYPRMYHRRQRDRATDTIELKLGWLTSSVTKPLMIGALGARARDREMTVRSTELCRQLGIYMRKPDGEMSAPNLMHDDGVMSAAIACALQADIPMPVIERIPDLVIVRNEITGYERLAQLPGQTKAGFETDDYSLVTGYNTGG